MSNSALLDGKRVVVTGGTGSLGKAAVRRMLTGEFGMPSKIIVFSRDEGKHHQMQTAFSNSRRTTEDIIYRNFQRLLEFRIGDVRDYASVAHVVEGAHIVIHAAALKQVPTCEYFPHEAVRTNIDGAHNVIQAIRERGSSVEKAIAISTDKACKPVNVMGMTKAVQERVFVEANVSCPRTSFLLVRYGNVVASRGSVVPLFEKQIAAGGPLTITTPEMTRFLISLDDAVNAIFAALATGLPGETFIPQLPSARVTDLAEVMIDGRPIDIEYIGIRPGEKVHEILISEEEMHRSLERGKYFAILPMLPELRQECASAPVLVREYSSQDCVVDKQAIRRLLDSGGAGDAAA
jgi:UDP-glucose 4-epimerase